MQLLPGISSFVVEVTVGDSYARTSTRRPPMLSLSTASLEWNETVSMWPAGPTNAAASVHMLQYNRHSSPPVTETLLETPSTATGGNDAARQRTVGTSPMPGNQNRRRGSGPLNGNSAARCWILFPCLLVPLRIQETDVLLQLDLFESSQTFTCIPENNT